MTMQPRQRLLTALHHKEADRVPVDLASTQVTGISLYAYRNLLAFLGQSEAEPLICDRIQNICLPAPSIMQRYGIDTRGLWPRTSHNYDFQDVDDGQYLSHTDEWGLGYRFSKTDGLWYNLYHHPLADRELSDAALAGFQWPAGGDHSRINGLREQALAFRQDGYAVVLKSICAGLLEMAIRLRGMENFLMDLMLDPQQAGCLLDRILQVKLDYWQMALAELAEVVDVIAEGDDFGTQQSQLIAPALFRQIIKPRQAELIAFMKQKAPHSFIFFHSCGNIRDILPDFIEMGIDIINPVHITAHGMEPQQLKNDFGREVVFWGGGIDTQDVLPHASPDQVREHVRRNLEILAPGGGFVFNTIHNIQADVAPQNIEALYRAVQDFGRY
jgi:uroporphyrinogen decarboxylase